MHYWNGHIKYLISNKRQSFKHAVNSCTQYIRHKQSIKSQSTSNFNIHHNTQNINVIESAQQKPTLHTDAATQTTNTSEAEIHTSN
jgi:hypothetical protein